jgi:myo-inositol-1-phosphate synthase
VGLAELGRASSSTRCAAPSSARSRLKGALIGPSSYFKKSPPVQVPDDRARELVEDFIRDPQSELGLRKQAPLPRVAARGRKSVAPSVNGVPAKSRAKSAKRRAGRAKASRRGVVGRRSR